MRAFFLFIATIFVLGGTVHANPKNKYWLFNPTPRNELRPIFADRPDKTETPHTVDAGHFQAEVSLFAFVYDWHNDTNTHLSGYSIMPMLLKMGVTNWMDVEVGLEPYVHNNTFDLSSGSSDLHNGFGDVTPRLKINFVGNDFGKFALGMIPFIKIPTNQDHVANDFYEGGIVIPLSYELDDEWTLGGQAQFNHLHREVGSGHVFGFSGTVDLMRKFTDHFGAFVEFYSDVTNEAGQSWVGTIDAGLTYELIPDYLLIDAAVDIGVTQDADDLNALFGFTFRY